VSHRSTAFRIAIAEAGAALPSSLDPDAPAREGKRLDPEDEFEQAQVGKTVVFDFFLVEGRFSFVFGIGWGRAETACGGLGVGAHVERR
jgi:hypothetical protein